ncbi:MAG: hypothetical protein ACUZ9M_00720 [Candidatus Scalindua sp.]
MRRIMTKTGKIIGVTPDGGYQGKKGYIYTFQMTVQCPDGQVTGQIGSKSQTYPLVVGNDIMVEVTNTEHGVRLKKVNPQYAEQQPTTQQPPPQSPQRPAQGNKDRLIVAQVVYKSLAAMCGDIDVFDVWLMDRTNVFSRHVDVIMQTGLNIKQAPPPDYVGDDAPPPSDDDNIPF